MCLFPVCVYAYDDKDGAEIIHRPNKTLYKLNRLIYGGSTQSICLTYLCYCSSGTSWKVNPHSLILIKVNTQEFTD